MTYNSYSNYQRMHSTLCSNSYIDGVPMAISDQFKPPPRIKLPRIRPRHVCDVIEQEYDFSLERRVLAEAESRKMAEIAEQEASRVASAMDDLSRLDSPDDKPKDPGKPEQKKDEPPTWTLGPEIMTPMLSTTTVPVEVGQPEKAQIRVKDFETVDDPFDDLELKVLDDMAELKSVLDVVQQSTSPVHNNTSPSLDNPKNELTNTKAVTEKAGPVLTNQAPPDTGAQLMDNMTSRTVTYPSQVEDMSSVPQQVAPGPPKRKPVNLDDYDISLPNIDHLMKAPVAVVDNNRPLAAGPDLRQYVTGNTMTSFPMMNCNPYSAPNANGFNPPITRTGYSNNVPYSQFPVIGSKSDSNTYSRPVIGQNSTSAVIGQENGRGPVIGGETFDEYRYKGYRMRSARSASDLTKLGDEETPSYRVSHSPPPRTPHIPQGRTPNGGRYSLGGPIMNHHPIPVSNQHTLPSKLPANQSSLSDPFTSLGVEEQDFVCMFVDMGFPRPRTARAVQIFGKDAKQVTDYLCLCDGLVEQGYSPEHVEVAAQLAQNQIKPAKDYLKVMRQLQEFGFPQSDIHKALRLHQADTDKCLDYLTSPT